VTLKEESVYISVGGSTVLKGEWEFKIEPEEDPDWELRDVKGRRVVHLTLRKKVMPGGFSIVIWWKRLLKGDPGIDVTDLEGRKTEKSQEFKKAWEEAHVKFKEQAAAHKPIEIDLPPPGCAPPGDDPMETS